MIQAEALAPIAAQAVPAAKVQPAPHSDKAVAYAPRLLSMTYLSVEMDGRNLWREPGDVVVAQLCEAIRLADLRGKEELYIDNITPWIQVGQTDTGRVPVIQEKLERLIEAACRQLDRDMPVCRLDLFRGTFGIRCYLGRSKPTDFIYEEDLLSDSR